MTRRDLISRRLFLKAAVLLAAGCSAPPAAKPTEAPKPTTAPTAASAPAASPAASPATSPAAAASPSPSPAAATTRSADSAAWQAIVEAAKREGRVVMYGSAISSDDVSKVAAAFKDATGLDFDFLSLLGPTAATRIREEVKANKGPDVFESTGGWLGQLGSEGLLVPLKDRPLPVWSEPVDVWNVHPGYKVDDWQYVLSRLRQRQGHIGVNTKLLAAADYPKSWHELGTDPRFKGMIAFTDPTVSGLASQELIMHGYIGKTMSLRDFWGLLAGQEPLLFKVARANVISVAQGERAITFPPIDESAMNLIQAGATVKNLAFPNAPILAQTADMGVIKAAQHPNAALVFVNWYLGKEGQDFLGRLLLQTSSRRDVPSYVPDVLRPDVVGGGQRGQMIIDTPVQSQLILDVQAAGVMKLLVEGGSADDFERAWTDFIKDWEPKHGGPQDTPTIFQP